MANEKIEVEWIATANKMVQVLDNLNTKFDKQDKALQKIADSSKKAANAAVGSFNKLEQELKENEAALKGLEMGTREFAEQRRKVDQLRAAVSRAKGELTQLNQASGTTFGQMAVAIGGPTVAALALVAALVKVADAQRQIVNEGAAAAISLDTMARKFQIQAGLTDPQRVEASKKIIEQSSEAGVKAETGFQAATQLAGSGFDNAIETGTLKTVLDTMQAGSFTGQADELVAAFSQMMNAMKLQKNNENLQAVAVASQSLFKKTDFQLVDLSEFAKIGATVESANVQFGEGMAAFTALRDSLPAGEAATGLRNLITKMQKGDITAEGKKDLERIGVKAEDVDFVGETLTQVLTNLKTATDKLPEADRNAALGKLFGTENVTTARMLISGVPRIQELQAVQQNAGQFELDRQTAAGSMQSAVNRTENAAILSSIPNAVEIAELSDRMKAAEDRNRIAVENAALAPVPGLGVAAQGAAVIDNAATAILKQDVGGGLGDVLSATLGGWFKKTDQNQVEQNQLLRENNELLRNQQRPPAAAQRPAAPARNARPGEAPLPGALIP